MRQLNFRVYDKTEKRMSEPFELGGNLLLFPRTEIYILSATRTPERFEFMQFTGLSDRDGKEIFEGDRIKGIYEPAHDPEARTVERTGFIFWNEENCCYWVEEGDCTREFPSTGWAVSYEVIGNIFEGENK